MRLVVIYGPPASGKLTVARELAALAGYRVFHNHATKDVVSAVLDISVKEHWGIVERLREDLIAAAAAAGVDLIFTTAYSPAGRPFIDRVTSAVGRAGGEVLFVRLCPSVAALEQRVTDPSRVAHGKIRDVESLRDALRDGEFDGRINESDLSIDNTDMTPNECAVLIRAHLTPELHGRVVP